MEITHNHRLATVATLARANDRLIDLVSRDRVSGRVSSVARGLTASGSPTQPQINPAPSTLPLRPPLPILPAEPDCHPADLLEAPSIMDRPWWLVYTRSRQEKQLMRRLRQLDLAHYAPQIANRKRSPAGRIRVTYQPLFINYVFLCGDEESRYQAVCTGCVQQINPIDDAQELVSDLKQIQELIRMDVPLTIESRLEPGQMVRVKNGAFAGYEGTVVQRMQETRLLVSVRFMEQGVSVKLDDCQLAPIGD